MPRTTSIRIAPPAAPEQHYIDLLSADERRAALVAAGRAKQRTIDAALRTTLIERILRGELAPLRRRPSDGQMMPGLDWSIAHPEGGDLVNIGRVPDFEEYEVYRGPDGRLRVFGPEELERLRELTRQQAAASTDAPADLGTQA